MILWVRRPVRSDSLQVSMGIPSLPIQPGILSQPRSSFISTHHPNTETNLRNSPGIRVETSTEKKGHVWYIRWVLVGIQSKFEHALACTQLDQQPRQILQWFLALAVDNLPKFRTHLGGRPTPGRLAIQRTTRCYEACFH